MAPPDPGHRWSSANCGRVHPGRPVPASCSPSSPPGTAVLLAAGMESDWLRAWYTEAIANCRIRYQREQGTHRCRRLQCLPCSVETATQTLHRLTSYQPGREWDEAIDDPRIVQDLEANDMSRLPWFVKRYPEPLPRTAAAPRTARHHRAGGGRAGGHRGGQARAPGPAEPVPPAVPVRRAWCAPWSGPTGPGPFRAAGSAGGRFPLELYVAVPRRAARCPPACTGTTRSTTRSCRSGRHRSGGDARPSSSPASRGAPAGDTANAGTGMSTGMPARCSPSCSRSPTRRAFQPRCTALPRRGRWPRCRARTGCTSARWRSSLWARAPPALDAEQARRPPATWTPRRWNSRSSRRRNGPGRATGSARRGTAVHPVDVPIHGRRPGRERHRSRAGPSGGWTRAAACPEDLLRTCMSVAVRGIGLPHWVVVHDVAGLAPGVYRWPDLRLRCARARCGTSCTGCAWTRRWPATRRSSPSPPPDIAASATGSTARRSSPPGWPKAGCTWPPTPSAPARPG